MWLFVGLSFLGAVVLGCIILIAIPLARRQRQSARNNSAPPNNEAAPAVIIYKKNAAYRPPCSTYDTTTKTDEPIYATIDENVCNKPRYY